MSGETFAVFASGVAVATSIGSLLLSWANYNRDRSHLKLLVQYSYITPQLDEAYIAINVINDGRYLEVVTSVGFLAANKQLLLIQPENFPQRPLPWRLAPNESEIAWVLESALVRQLSENKLPAIERAFAGTQSGRKYIEDVPEGVRKTLHADAR